jgi:hypothetical protein
LQNNFEEKFINVIDDSFIDWGLGIGDWAQSPIPNPQSPIPIYSLIEIWFKLYLKKYNLKELFIY